MPAETTVYKIKYAIGTDEVKAFPAEVSQVGAEKIDTVLKEHNLKIKKYAGAASPVSGELVVQEKSGETVTLPAVATADQQIGIFSKVAETKVTGAAETIGDFTASASFVLSTNQHVVLQSDGVKWLIIAGEPKRTAGYSARVARTSGVELEASATRPVFVAVVAVGKASEAAKVELYIGGELVGFQSSPAAAATNTSFFVAGIVPAGVKWKPVGEHLASLESTYLSL